MAAFDGHKNLSYSTVATAPSPAASGTSLVVSAGDGAKFPAVPFNATIWPTNTQPTTSNAEIVRVTNISTDTFTITRAQESSAARTVVIGDQIAATVTAKTITDIETGLGATSGYTLVGQGAGNVPIGVATGAPIVSVLTDGATPALDASLGTVFTLSAAGDRTIAVPSNATSGQKIIIRHFASGGARTLALNSGAGGFKFGSDISALTQTASGKYDYIGCVYNAAASLWDVVGYVKGL